jgi:hypothetical protein
MVRLTEMHSSGLPGHVDVEFTLDHRAEHPISLWDCVTGFGNTAELRAECAAAMWGQTTAAALLELAYSRRGHFADHYRGSDKGGLAGWHCIAGPILGYGKGDSGNILQRWWVANPVLPSLGPALGDCLSDEVCPNGIKMLFGGPDVAEIRVDGQRHEGASLALGKLPWPRLSDVGFVRSYAIVLHRDEGGRW